VNETRGNSAGVRKPAAKKAVRRPSVRPDLSSAKRLEAAQQAIGNFLRATRTAQKLTQAQVASMTRESPWQLSRAAISAIERGQNFPGMEAMLALSNVLYVDPKELIERARLSTVVPVDISGVTFADLDRKASDFFWSGEFRKAVSVYDAMLEKIALEPNGDREQKARRVATLEVRRATALKRAGALQAAIATVERAISLSASFPDIQVEAYVVLAGLQCQRGLLPLARDAAQRAIDLSTDAAPPAQGWAWMVKARTDYLAGRYEEARQAFLESRRLAELSGDHHHLTHIDGNIGSCHQALGHTDEARRWFRRAVDSARIRNQPSLEASWLIELGRIALSENQTDKADRLAQAALRIARPREQLLTIFRAEWLRHLVARQADPAKSDGGRLAYLRKLFMQLDEHEGIDEIQEFRRTAIRFGTVESGNEL
jgi:tetratricopeptide (TPR) repeat protein